MSIQEGASEIVFACYRSPNMTLTGNSAAKDSAGCRRWRMAGVIENGSHHGRSSVGHFARIEVRAVGS
jgi:hypothetical protein